MLPHAVSVLLVDDRADKLLALESMLEPLGYTIRKVGSGKDALRILLKERFHLVILDVNMPGLDGFETARLIRERESLTELPIIFVSAYDATDEEMEKGYSLGAVDYIHTPIHPAVLRARVATFVALRARTDELQTANVHLRDVNEQMNAFVYTVSHDLRAPLRSINSFSRILLEECQEQLDSYHLDFLKRIALSGLKMNELLDDLLQYSRLAHSELDLQPVALGDLVTGIMADMRGQIQERGAAFNVAKTFPVVVGNATLIDQVLRNLFENAMKFVPSGSKPSVRVSSSQDEHTATITVEDDGIGIAPEHQQRIFGVFERLHRAEEFPGTGIGLAIVRRAVERMGGRAGVESTLGKGSRFWFELPLVERA